MGIKFDILEGTGPKMLDTWTTKEAVDSITAIDPDKYVSFVGQTLRNLKREVGNSAAVLGFIGAPYTVASYMIEGGSSSDFRAAKTFSYERPELFHQMLKKLTANLALYAIYQIDNGAQAIQIFDSWAGNLDPQDYDEFAARYQKELITSVKKARPNVPLILYINKAGSVIEKMAAVQPDIISVDWTITLNEAVKRIGNPSIGVQGNLDPMLLHAPANVIQDRTNAVLKEGKGKRHIMNLGHGIDSTTPEENVKLFVDFVKKKQNVIDL